MTLAEIVQIVDDLSLRQAMNLFKAAEVGGQGMS